MMPAMASLAAKSESELQGQLRATLKVIPAYPWYALPSGALIFVSDRTARLPRSLRGFLWGLRDQNHRQDDDRVLRLGAIIWLEFKHIGFFFSTVSNHALVRT
jgi:hypothetical protein